MADFRPALNHAEVQIAPAAKEEPMALVAALDILARAFTRDDDLTGFVVQSRPDLMFIGQGDYIRAWESVRRALGLPCDPTVTR